MADKKSLRSLPAVDQLLNSEKLKWAVEALSPVLVTTVIRSTLDNYREKYKSGKSLPSVAKIETEINQKLISLQRQRITRVINGTGVMIHTNLGRAPLGKELYQRVADRVSGYNTLEFDLAKGKRGKRGSFLSYLLAQLTKSESALAVNNNAAALYLILNTFAIRKEVLVSRSELVQIGGGFRIPDIIRRAGCKLVEVGTTNKTSLADYQNAITKRTSMILKVHRSNFAISGFVEEPSLPQLSKLAKEHNLISVYDLGSGSYHQTEKFGMQREDNITDGLRSGYDVVCFSGDKLLGAAQAGVILSSDLLANKMHKNPIYRVVRLDKIAIAILEEVIFSYLKGNELTDLPLWKIINTSIKELQKRAELISKNLKSTGVSVAIAKSTATPGGGSMPGGKLDSLSLVLTPNISSQKLVKKMLDADPPLVCYIENDQIYLDLRTIDESDDNNLIRIITEVADCLQ